MNFPTEIVSERHALRIRAGFEPGAVLSIGAALWIAVVSCGKPVTPAPPSHPAPSVAEVSLKHVVRDSVASDRSQNEAIPVDQPLLEDDLDGTLAEPAFSAPQAGPHPLTELPDERLFHMLRDAPHELGSMSIGKPNSGRLLNAVQLPEDPRWVVVDPSHAFGTAETLAYIEAAVDRVGREHSGTPPLHIGHISGQAGGWLRPHRSHQAGRDVDLGYYYRGGGQWYQRATRDSLDIERTWALVRALAIETDVRFILIDRAIQIWLREHAVKSGEDPQWVLDLFEGTAGKSPALIRHVAGHATHMHVRFYNPIAQETARRCHRGLVQLQLIKPPTHYVQHRVRKGETLTHLAKRYGTTVPAIKRANQLRSNTIMARKSYRIPQTGAAAVPGPVEVPPRRLPPRAQGS